MKINEIFCSVQGEGHFTGRPSVFLRTSGCNLACPFCDTQHHEGKDMSIEDIAAYVQEFPPRHAVITGGEPTLQPDLSQLVDELHRMGFFVQLETNGTRPVPSNVDWVTCSPKVLEQTVVRSPHELKVVYEQQDMTPYERTFHAQVYSLQPCDTGNKARNAEVTSLALDYVLSHPQWNLSLQTHKFIGAR